MPELPEVETMRRGILSLVGATIASAIEINRPVNLKKCLRAIDFCDGVVRQGDRDAIGHHTCARQRDLDPLHRVRRARELAAKDEGRLARLVRGQVRPGDLDAIAVPDEQAWLATRAKHLIY